MSVIIVCALFVSVTGFIMASSPMSLPGVCPEYQFTNALDNEKFVGDWHVVHTASNGFDGFGDRLCAMRTLEATSSGGLQSAFSTVVGDKIVQVPIRAEPVPTTKAKYEINVADKPTIQMSYIDSDSTNYAAVAFCTSNGTNHGRYIEIVSRRRTLEASFVEKAKVALAAAKITDPLVPNDTNC